MKNVNCRDCDYYLIGGPKRCAGIQQKYYEEFKSICPCRICSVRSKCKAKIDIVLQNKYNNFRNLPISACPEFKEVLSRFIKNISRYYEDSSYGDPQWHYNNVISKRNIVRVIDLLEFKNQIDFHKGVWFDYMKDKEFHKMEVF